MDNAVPVKPFSDTVKALLVFTKRSELELNLETVLDCLREIYHPEMKLKDVIVVLLNALQEITSIPQFESPSVSYLALKIASAPIQGTSCLGEHPFGPNRTDKFTVEEFYDSMIKELLNVFRFSNVGWCREYLFPNEKEVTA